MGSYEMGRGDGRVIGGAHDKRIGGGAAMTSLVIIVCGWTRWCTDLARGRIVVQLVLFDLTWL